MDTYGLIYLATNRETGKVYVGQTMLSFEDKIKEYRLKSQYDQRRYFTRSLKKHGFKAFEWSRLESCECQSQLDEAERRWIAFYKSTDASIGYNLESGGITCARRNERSSLKHKETIRNKVAKGWTSPRKGKKTNRPGANLGKKFGPEVAEKILATKLERYGRLGVVNSTCIKAGQRLSPKTEFKPRAIICIETSQSFDSIKAAATFFGCDISSIHAALSGKSKRSMGHTWKYAEPVAIFDSAFPTMHQEDAELALSA